MNERTSMIENNDEHEWNDKYGEAINKHEEMVNMNKMESINRMTSMKQMMRMNDRRSCSR